MIVREIQPGEECNWDEYVRKCPYSTPQHLFAWKKVMEGAFNSKTYYLVAEENGTFQGVLPLIHVKSLLAGNYVTSLPGGICTENDEAARQLYEYARELVDAGKARYLILRDSLKKWDLKNIVTDEELVTFLVKTTQSLDKLLSSMRRRARRAATELFNDGSRAMIGMSNLSTYYPIYLKSMREMGTPTLGLGFFEWLNEDFENAINLITLTHGTQIIGGGFVFPFKQTIYCLWSGLLREYYQYHPSFQLSWEVIKLAHHSNYQFVDLGRCRKGSGGYEFKLGFGGEEKQLYQQFYLNGINRTPNIGGERKADIKYQIFIKFWQLLPIQITELLGPVLRKQMPFG